MPNSEDFDIQNEDDLREAVRRETQYDEKALSTTELGEIIDSAKRVLALKAGVTTFFDDRGIAVALAGLCMAKAKGSVENSPVQVKDLAGQNVTFRTSDGSSLQISEYESMTQLGLSESNKTDQGTNNFRFTNDWLTDSSSS